MAGSDSRAAEFVPDGGEAVRVVLLGAGGPAGFNFLHSLASDDELAREIDCFEVFDHNLLHLRLLAGLPGPIRPAVMQGFDTGQLGKCDRADTVMHAQPDPLVPQLARYAPTRARKLLPGMQTIEICRDKYLSQCVWAECSLAPLAKPLAFRGDLDEVEDVVGYPMWIRARTGAGARLASPAHSRDEAGPWLHYIVHRFGKNELVASPYLPGRDYAVTTLWKDNHLLAILCRERLEYLYPQHAVSGRTGTPVVARLILDPRVETVALSACRAIAAHTGEPLSGLMCVDLRCDEDGNPVPTEINAGRFFTTSHIGLKVGLNIPALYVRAAFGDAPSETRHLAQEFHGTLVIRHMDAGTHWLLPHEQDEGTRAFVAEMAA